MASFRRISEDRAWALVAWHSFPVLPTFTIKIACTLSEHTAVPSESFAEASLRRKDTGKSPEVTSSLERKSRDPQAAIHCASGIVLIVLSPTALMAVLRGIPGQSIVLSMTVNGHATMAEILLCLSIHRDCLSITDTRGQEKPPLFSSIGLK
jgi:hypothetical protein